MAAATIRSKKNRDFIANLPTNIKAFAIFQTRRRAEQLFRGLGRLCWDTHVGWKPSFECGHHARIHFIFVFDHSGDFKESLVVITQVFVVTDNLLDKGSLQVFDAVLHGVTGFESHTITDFVEVDAVIPAVGIRHLLYFRSGEHLLDDLGHALQSVVQARVAHIEYLSAHKSDRRVDRRNDSFHDITNVNERPPLLAIEDGDLAILIRAGCQQIDDEIKPRAVSETEDGRESKDRRVEVLALRRQQRQFGINFGLSIERDWADLRPLIHLVVRRSVHTAARSK